ncbi:uncharacterized protein LOC124290951 [Haliotis rubra]|uniref:uncharacterized protein LOC124290951 n=1 Tax=Haliotis rubra TaxID=36100 RepID=UPI001EE54921|nr:uncharacterized protein LOC124290951 [Haliotis rubra]
MGLFNTSPQRAAFTEESRGSYTCEDNTPPCLISLNKLGVTLSPTSKITLLDECAIQNMQTIIKALQTCPLCNLACRNSLEPVIEETLHQSHRSNTRKISSARERMLLLQSYKVLMGRRLAKYIPALEWMASVLPDHIPHRFSDTMAKKSIIVPSRLMILNEAKYEDCVQILDNTEDILRESFSEALGSSAELEKLKVPFWGDQLTRIRLQYAKPLRAHAPNPIKRFEDVGPFMCTMWHNKQDFLHKAYRRFYNKNSGRDRGSLFHFKVFLRRTSVDGQVKNNYTGHEELFLLIGDMLMVEQALEYLGMETYDSQPTKIIIPDNIMRLPRHTRADLADKVLIGILNTYDYGNFSLAQHQESSINPPIHNKIQTVHVVNGLTPDGEIIFSQQDVPVQEDEVLSYCNNLAQWAMQLMHMNDTAKEGDIDRMAMRTDMERVITRLCRGQMVEVDPDDEYEENDGLPSI